ncbi:hypothetical protein CBM2606_A160181 [Cupriavidus taiwanensis]|nr:hypothetical protein CBM2606_A160181 [Cupriavidus taiwanensis]
MCPCTPCAPTSTTASPKQKPPTASSVSRCGSTRGITSAAMTRRWWKSRKTSVVVARVVRKAAAVKAKAVRVATAVAVPVPVVALRLAQMGRVENNDAAT